MAPRTGRAFFEIQPSRRRDSCSHTPYVSHLWKVRTIGGTVHTSADVCRLSYASANKDTLLAEAGTEVVFAGDQSVFRLCDKVSSQSGESALLRGFCAFASHLFWPKGRSRKRVKKGPNPGGQQARQNRIHSRWNDLSSFCGVGGNIFARIVSQLLLTTTRDKLKSIFSF